MRVALAIQHFPPYRGGAEQQARLLARRLATLTERCDVITSRHEPGLPRVSHEGDARVIRLPTAGPQRVRRAVNGLVAFAYFVYNGGRYDVVHAHCLSPFALGAILGARLRGTRTVLKICTLGACGDVAKVRDGRLGGWLWRGFAQTDRWVTTSAAGREEALAQGLPEQRVSLVPNGVEVPDLPTRADPRSVAERRRELGLADRPTCLYVGRLVPGKGLDAIVRAWPTIQARSGAALALVGDGPLGAQLREWAEAPALAGSVQLIGWQADPSRYYAAADLLLFPSTSEAFGNVLAEAMAHGVAVLTTPVGLASRYARHRENAWVLPGACDQAELAGAIQHAACELLADPELRLALGERARATARASFEVEPVVNTYLEIYRALVAGDARRGCATPAARAVPPLETDHA